jgi:hypothetical protein
MRGYSVESRRSDSESGQRKSLHRRGVTHQARGHDKWQRHGPWLFLKGLPGGIELDFIHQSLSSSTQGEGTAESTQVSINRGKFFQICNFKESRSRVCVPVCV